MGGFAVSCLQKVDGLLRVGMAWKIGNASAEESVD